MSNSPLVKYTKLSPNHSGKRTHKIDTITPHCVVGHLSLQTLGNVFATTKRQASCNYGIDDYGQVGMYVEEGNRSWCTSSNANDQRAVTIEIASDLKDPYAITDKALEGLIILCADICKRNGIPKLLWKADKRLIGKIDQQNITVHRWFANKSCPGDYIYNRLGLVADEVNKRLGGDSKIVTPDKTIKPPSANGLPYIVIVTAAELNVRKGPSVNDPITTRVHRGDVFTIVSEALGRGASKWGKLKSGAGWVSLDFVERK